jgi:Rieske Fe-S protein
VVGVFVEKKEANGPLTAGNLRMVEQTCTHLGCPVIWNGAADPQAGGGALGRFQCPCHGSQFHRDLSVAHGPANDPLFRHDFTLSGSTLTILGRRA